jgi:hypothetical protein
MKAMHYHNEEGRLLFGKFMPKRLSRGDRK